MRHPDRIALLIRLLPFAAWKDALIRGHVERCPECGRRLATAEDARRAIVRGVDVSCTDRLQQAVAAKIVGFSELSALGPAPSCESSPSALGRAWRWAAAAAGIFAAVLATAALVLFFRSAPPAGSPYAADAAESEQFQIHYVRIGDEPAQTFVFKPHDSDVIIVWAGKTH